MKRKELFEVIKNKIVNSDTTFVNKLSKEEINELSEEICDAMIDFLVDQAEDSEYLFEPSGQETTWVVDVTKFVNDEG